MCRGVRQRGETCRMQSRIVAGRARTVQVEEEAEFDGRAAAVPVAMPSAKRVRKSCCIDSVEGQGNGGHAVLVEDRADFPVHRRNARLCLWRRSVVNERPSVYGYRCYVTLQDAAGAVFKAII